VTAFATTEDLILLRERRRRKQCAPVPDIRVWVRSEATIVHPVRGRIPFVPYAYQDALFAAYDHPRRILLKARQVGISQAFALEGLYTALHYPEQTILFVSRSQDLATNLLLYCYKTYSNLRSPLTLRKENESEMGFVNGSRIKSLPANRSTGRGFAPSRVYLDEFAYAEYADDIYQSVSPAVSQGGSLTIGSTPNGVGNLFHELYTSGDGFTRFCVPWWDCPAYWTPEEQAAGIPKEQSAWYQHQRPNYAEQQWASEFGVDFTGSGLNLFKETDIIRATQGALGSQPRQPGHTYLTSVDIGRRQDATVINTFDTTKEPYQRVAFQRLERVAYPLIQQAIETRQRAYGGRLVIESNGVGDPVIENLNVPAIPFITTAKSKVQALQSLQLLLEQGRLKAQWEARERKALIAYAWDDDHTADEVMSLAIGATFLDRAIVQPARSHSYVTLG
jgi:hypothetical protein